MTVFLQTCLFLLFVGVIHGQNFETGDNSTVRGCSTHCSYHDKDITCWSKNLDFFEKVLLGQIRHYISVQINIDQFHRRHDGENYKPDFVGMRERSIQRISSFITPDDFVTNHTIREVITELIQRVENGSQETISWMPHYSCPLPCEYRFNIWRNLFIISMILNLCLIIAVMPYVYRANQHDSTEALI